MVVSTASARTTPRRALEAGGKTFEAVDSFVYLGSEVNSNNGLSAEVTRRITAGNRAYFSLKSQFRSRFLNRRLKCKLYTMLIRPVVTYGSETWCLLEADKKRLRAFECGILRSIFGGVCESGVWRRRVNAELQNLYEDTDIVRFIKIGRLRWLGHTERMSATRGPRVLRDSNPVGGRRRAGHPRARWMDAVADDLSVLGVRNWKSLARNRDDWRKLLLEAKTVRRL